jgi:hypothetical protein
MLTNTPLLPAITIFYFTKFLMFSLLSAKEDGVIATQVVCL